MVEVNEKIKKNNNNNISAVRAQKLIFEKVSVVLLSKLDMITDNNTVYMVFLIETSAFFNCRC